MVIASLDVADATLTWLGVGNVEARVLRGGVIGSEVVEVAPLASGIAGICLPVLRPQTVRLRGGEVVLMTTDGVVLPALEFVRPARPALMAEEILAQGARESDDALVLAARYHGRR
jgi:hypothetical protein